AIVEPVSPDKPQRRASSELSTKLHPELKVESAPKSTLEPESRPLPALPARAPVADASRITRQPAAEAPATLAESKPRAAAVPAERQAAVADSSVFPGQSDDAGIRLPARVTYYDLHKNDPVTVVGPVFPGQSDDAGIRLPARVTYYDLHKNDPV